MAVVSVGFHGHACSKMTMSGPDVTVQSRDMRKIGIQ
jgi:hypothetical protein